MNEKFHDTLSPKSKSIVSIRTCKYEYNHDFFKFLFTFLRSNGLCIIRKPPAEDLDCEQSDSSGFSIWNYLLYNITGSNSLLYCTIECTAPRTDFYLFAPIINSHLLLQGFSPSSKFRRQICIYLSSIFFRSILLSRLDITGFPQPGTRCNFSNAYMKNGLVHCTNGCILYSGLEIWIFCG